MNRICLVILALLTVSATFLTGCTTESLVAGQATKYAFKEYKESKEKNGTESPHTVARLKSDVFIVSQGFGFTLATPGRAGTPAVDEYVLHPYNHKKIKGVIPAGTYISSLRTTSKGSDGAIESGEFTNKRVKLDAVQDQLQYETR